jgi:hypothetical protein
MAEALAEKLSALAETEMRDVARRYVAVHGRKRGLFLLGRYLGGERRAAGIYYGEAARITAGEYLAAREADRVLREHERAALRARLDQIERDMGAGDGASDALGLGARVSLAGAAG